MKKYTYVILGAGPTALGAAHRLIELGKTDFIIVEKENTPGGLSRSFVDEKGFTWDLGGHVQFSHYAYFDNLMQQLLGNDGWLKHQRESWVWIANRFVPYPFQNNIRYLPKDMMWKCLQGIIQQYKKQQTTHPQNFYEWIIATFGSGLADIFMVPYNYKVWAYHPQKMSYKWVGERVAITDLERVTDNILHEKEDLSWGPNNTFQFPKQGGTGAIWIALAQRIGADKFMLNTTYQNIDPIKKIIYTDKEPIAYESVLNTTPLDLFTKSIEGMPVAYLDESKKLIHSATHVVGIGLKGKPSPDLKTKCWMYFPENNCPFYRVTVFSNYSPQNVPDSTAQWSLMAEVSESTDKTVDVETIIEACIQGALNTQLINAREEIVSTWHKRLEYGYPTPSLQRDEAVDKLIPYLDKQQLYSRGRFGAWRYEVSNQDHSMMQGVEWANKQILGIAELTFRFPNLVNTNLDHY